MLKGQFEKFTKLPKPDGRNAAKVVRDDLLEIIRSYDDLRSVGVCIPMEEWNAVASRPEAAGILEHPYHRAIESVGTETARRGFQVIHPTQKPIALMEYLIRPYSKPGDVIFDNCMGSGTTGVACVNTGREIIGIERDASYFAVAQRRIAEATATQSRQKHESLHTLQVSGGSKVRSAYGD